MGASFDINDLYNATWSARLKKFAREKYGHLCDADLLMEDARQVAATRIHDQLDRYPGKSVSNAYVVAVFRSAMVDELRRRNGYPRPSEWLKAQGRLGELLFELLCLQKSTLEAICEAIGKVDSKDWVAPDEARIRALVQEMERRRECAGKRRDEVAIDGQDEDGPVMQLVDESLSGRPDGLCEDSELDRVIAALVNGAEAFGGADIEALGRRVLEVRERLGKQVVLSDEEAFVLRGFFILNDTYGSIGANLGGLNERQVRYRCDQAVGKLKRLFTELGMSISDLMDE